jgi:hypothetical protein
MIPRNTGKIVSLGLGHQELVPLFLSIARRHLAELLKTVHNLIQRLEIHLFPTTKRRIARPPSQLYLTLTE